MKLTRKQRWFWDAGLWVPVRPAIILPRERNLLPGFCPAHLTGAADNDPNGYNQLTWRDGVTSTVDQTTTTFSNQSIGTPSEFRYVIVGVGHQGNGTVSCTVGGVSADLIDDGGTTASNGTSNGACSMFIAHVPTGTTADIVVTGTSITCVHMGYWTVRMSTYSLAYDVITAGSGSSSGETLTFNIPANGFAVGTSFYSQTTDQTHTIDQSFVEREETFAERNCAWSDKEVVSAQSSLSIIDDWTGSNTSCRIVYASFNGNT